MDIQYTNGNGVNAATKKQPSKTLNTQVLHRQGMCSSALSVHAAARQGAGALELSWRCAGDVLEMRTLAHPPQHASMVHGVGRGEGGASLNALPSRWRLSLVVRWLE